MKLLTLLALVLFSSVASGQLGWRDSQGQGVPNSESRKSQDGFGGSVLATLDADWKAKWNTPSGTIPNFSEAKKVLRGQRVFVLIFFANPKLNVSDEASVSCDIEVVRPDGTRSMNQADMVCFKGQLQGNPLNTRLSAPVIGFVGDPGDPAGKWTIRVNLKDDNRQVSLPLETSFILADQ